VVIEVIDIYDLILMVDLKDENKVFVNVNPIVLLEGLSQEFVVMVWILSDFFDFI
jgi:hypothetical protein|tara:strand:+ start:401 stop:565 length:165 start_codon:yes stop_codon:yes gene_type:complete